MLIKLVSKKLKHDLNISKKAEKRFMIRIRLMITVAKRNRNSFFVRRRIIRISILSEYSCSYGGLIFVILPNIRPF